METSCCQESYKVTPYLLTKHGIIEDVGDAFTSLTGYSRTELHKKDISQVIKYLLRINNSIHALESNESKKYTFLFTKSQEAREVEVSFEHGLSDDEEIYTFSERPNSRLEDKILFFRKFMMQEKAGIAIYSVPDFILLKANNKYLEYLSKAIDYGRNKDVDSDYANKKCYLGNCISDIIPNWNKSKIKETWDNIIKNNEPFNITERKGLLGDYDERYWDNTLTPIDENGEVRYLVSILEDVTDRVNNRKTMDEYYETIKKQASQLQTITENMNDALLVYDKYGNVITMNYVAKDLLYKPNNYEKAGDECQTNLYMSLDNNKIPLNEIPLVRALRGERINNYKMIIKRPDKEVYINVNASPIFDPTGGLSMVVMCCCDITDLLNREHELIKQKEQLEIIIDNISDGLLIVDKSGKFIRANKAIDDFLINSIENRGDTLNLGIKYFNEFGKELLIDDLPSSRVIKGEKIEKQRIMLRHEGKNIYLETSATPVFDDKGEFQLGVITSRNATERVEYHRLKEAHQQLFIKAQIEKNKELENAIKMKDEFISLVSHEFKTPLTVINSAIQAIEFLCKAEMTDKLKGFLGKIKQNSNRLLRLVNNLLDISRLNAECVKVNKKNMDIVFLTKVILESVRLYSEQKGLKLFFLPALKKKIIGLDEEKYERILLNLLSNAIKFTPKGKSIVVKLSLKRGIVCIEVIDEGIGIPADKQELIFERFGQVDNSLARQAEGTGIGLSLVKLFVESLGGSITVKSEVEKGSNFSVLLPSTRVLENQDEKCLRQIQDDRVIQSTTIEFSDIYLY